MGWGDTRSSANVPVRFLPPTGDRTPTRHPSPRPAPPPTLGQVSGGQWASAGQVPANSLLAEQQPWSGPAVLGGSRAGVGSDVTRKGEPGRPQKRLAVAHAPRAWAVAESCPLGRGDHAPGRAQWLNSVLGLSHAPRRSAPGSPARAERGRAGGRGR